MNEYACRAGGGRGCVATLLPSVASLVLAYTYDDPQVYVRTPSHSRGRSAQAGKNAMHRPPLDYCPVPLRKKRPGLEFFRPGPLASGLSSADHSAAKPQASRTNSRTPGRPSFWASR